MTTRWEPILDGAHAEAARGVVREIALALGNSAAEPTRPDELVLFWAYAAGAFDDEPSDRRYDAATAALVAQIEQGFGRLPLYGGLAGAGWVLAHVSGDGGADDFLAAVDGVLVEALAVERWTYDYDLILGLTGLAVYFLERLAGPSPTPVARVGLEGVIRHLAANARPRDGGIAWHTRPELLPPWQRELSPDGYYNCGTAHGVPGAISVLARAAALPDPPARARELVDGATRWLRTQAGPDPRGRFPSSMMPGKPVQSARTAWCYGDPGIAAALWSAAARTGAATAEWRDLALACASRPTERSAIADAGLCHGAMGLGHLFNRFYQASGDGVFRDAARTWFARGLALRQPGKGIAGFLAYAPPTPAASVRDSEWRTTEGFLEGAIGIGLALLAAIGDEEPGWDRLLACDIPVRGRS